MPFKTQKNNEIIAFTIDAKKKFTFIPFENSSTLRLINILINCPLFIHNLNKGTKRRARICHEY